MRAVEAQFQGNGTAVSLMFLAKFCARGDTVVDHHKVQRFFALFGVDGGKEHAAGLKAHHLSRRQVHDRDERLAKKLVWLIELVDAGENLAVGAGTVVECDTARPPRREAGS